ncbi:hypothetical protein FRB94_000046 [Tulasnella sp. JGI-2019a]|nr:hypothetical protein FRB94_000046 [Tulasnella sp. JGI-2019a]KAG9015733.1 hypothetical protein FRB93_012297 [Tulasnella sp. JGI-2019a]KAG9039636.1 hypothetical protein FRB95_009217 [Tulasnella sp. JGI-2019a]
MPLSLFPYPGMGRKGSQSDSHPDRGILNMENAYVSMQHFNSHQFAPLTSSPGQSPAEYPAFVQRAAAAARYHAAMGQGGLAPGFPPYPWAVPDMYPMDLLPQMDTQAVSIHVLLSPSNPMVQQPHVLYDVRYKRERAYMTTHSFMVKLPDEYADQPATQPPVAKMWLICHDIPWRIAVTNHKGVTIRDILEAIHKELHVPITEGEWWIAQEEERERTLAAYQDSCSEGVQEDVRRKHSEGVKRVDWLGKRTMFMSILRLPMDEAFIKARVPDKKAQAETWVLDLGEIT